MGKNKKSSRGFILATLLVLLLLIFAGCAACMTFYIIDVSRTLPSKEELRELQLSMATVIYDRNGDRITQLSSENRTWIDFDNISPWMVKAILAAEDDNFFEHSGVKPLAILRAGVVNIFSRSAKQGASTITQQLARNIGGYLTHEKTISRKVKELIIAFRLEQVYKKQELLEMYLNTIYMGHGTYGVEAAARFYYGKSASKLDINESASLAGLVAAPEKYSPFRKKEAFHRRRGYVLGRMLDLDWISKNDYTSCIDKTPKLKQRKKKANNLNINSAPYFVSHILFNELLPAYGADEVYTGGLKVYTTLDRDLQAKAEELASQMSHQCALVAIDPNTGEVLAMVGGRNFAESEFNRATQAHRLPGSSFKPIVYATAMEQSYRAIDHFLDAPIVFENGWAPKNYENEYLGEVTMMTAVAKSINTTAVRAVSIVGVDKVIDMAQRIGITTEHLPADLSIALGTASVTPLEMSVVYSVFANGGSKITPYFIKEIRSPKNAPMKQNGAGENITNPISSTVAVCMRSVLEQTMIWGTGSRGAFKDYESFGKTGTTNNCTDAWFAGGVPGLVCVVYVGNDKHTSLGAKATGAQMALPLWKKFMDYAVTKLNLEHKFEVPSNADVEQITVCRDTGFLACDGCKKATILVPSGCAPSSKCPWHGGNSALARDDENAPQLLLASYDDNNQTDSYAASQPQNDESTSEASEETELPKENSVKPESVPVRLHKKKIEDKQPLPEQKTVDTWYEEQLKKYKIDQ